MNQINKAIEFIAFFTPNCFGFAILSHCKAIKILLHCMKARLFIPSIMIQ